MMLTHSAVDRYTPRGYLSTTGFVATQGDLGNIRKCPIISPGEARNNFYRWTTYGIEWERPGNKQSNWLPDLSPSEESPRSVDEADVAAQKCPRNLQVARFKKVLSRKKA